MHPADDRALVRGIHMVKRHQRQTAQQEGGIVSKEATIHLSNLALADPKDGKPTRVGFKFVGEGADRKKVRIAKRSGSGDRWLTRKKTPNRKRPSRRRARPKPPKARAEG